jgi:predicted aspartyl protease
VLLAFLVDTGADVSVVPDGVARDLRLPVVGQIAVRGITGPLRNARVYAAEVEAGGGRNLVEVVGMGGDALIGRDLLNQWTVTLRGPRLVMDVVIGSGA